MNCFLIMLSIKDRYINQKIVFILKFKEQKSKNVKMVKNRHGHGHQKTKCNVITNASVHMTSIDDRK